MSRAWIKKKQNQNSTVWLIGWYENGKRKSKTKYSSDQARMFRAEIEHRLNMGQPGSLLAVPWEKLRAEYIQAKIAERKAKATIAEIKRTLKNFERLVGTPASTTITQESVDKFKSARGAECRSANTLNKDLANLKAFIRYFSIDRAYIRPLTVKRVKAAVKPVKALKENQIQTLLQSLKFHNQNYYIRALLALCAGLDASTIDNIMIHHIDFESDTIDTYRPKKDAWHHERPIQAEVMKEISNFVAEQPSGQLRLLPDLYNWQKWTQLCLQAGVKTTFHQLRKTYASLLQQKGVSLAVASELLDHESIETTKRWYTDVSGLHKTANDSLPVEEWIG
jgi:integrase